MGGGETEDKLPGERISVLPQNAETKADESLKGEAPTLPAAEALAEWPQESSSAAHAVPHIAFSGSFAGADAKIGDGNGWKESGVTPSPVVAGGRVFAMDARGFVTAHDAASLAVLWTSALGVNADETDVLGGGFAFEGGVLYGTSGNGKVFALDAATGAEKWQRALNLPMRSAPLLAYDKLFVLTAGNELYALNAKDGTTAWTHQGIVENAGFLGMVTPAAAEGLVIVPYSSGEIRALKAESGEEAWTDSLVLPRRTSAASVFTGIDANPVIEGGVVYAVGNGGVLAASNLVSGQRVWEQEISAINTPAVIGDSVFLLSSAGELMAFKKEDGRVRWVKPLLTRDGDETILWFGPLLAGGKLWLVSDHGHAAAFDPATGSPAGEFSVAVGLSTAPVIANGTLYVVGKDAQLRAYK